MFASTAGNNPGQSQSLLLQPGTPVHRRQPDAAVAAAAVRRVAGRLPGRHGTVRADVRDTGVQTDEGDLKTGYVQSWNIGVQRLIMKNTVHRGPLHRQQGPQPLAHVQPERSEHLRERVPRRVQARAAEPGDQRGQRPHGLRQQRPARPGARCRSSTRRSARAARRRRCRPTRASPTAGSSPTCGRAKRAGSPAACRATRPTSAAWSAARSRRAPAANYTAPGPYPMNFFVSESVRASAAASTSSTTTAYRSTTRCSCSCAAATRTG